MEQFGYLCSAYCKGLAERKKIALPFCEYQKTARMAAEHRRGTKFLVLVCAGGALLIAWLITYNFFLAKPKLAYSIPAAKSSPWAFAQWVPPGNVVLASAQRVQMIEATSRKQIWSTDLVLAAGTRERSTRGQELRAKVSGKDLWVFLGNGALRLDLATGKQKQELPLPGNFTENYLGEDSYLRVAQPGVARAVTLLNLDSGHSQTATINEPSLRQLAAAITARALPAGGGGKEDDPLPECEREFFVSDSSVVQLQWRLLEARVEAVGKQKSSVLDSKELRASQGAEATDEFLHGTAGPRLEDQSRYMVTLKRVLGSGASWSGEVIGAPVFLPSRSLDLLAAGRTLYAFSKEGQQIWESKLSAPLSPRYVRSTSEEIPAVESGGTLYVFDQSTLAALDTRSGEVKWRVQTVGTSQVLPDANKKLYVITTSAGPDQLNPSHDIQYSAKVKPLLLKIDAKTGATLWDSLDSVDHVYLSGKYFYGSRAQLSSADLFTEQTSHGEYQAPVHHRVFRLDPSNGRQLWEVYHEGNSLDVEVKNRSVFICYSDEFQAIRYFAF
jgi:hypothetical protein